jgi:hypothetical protein
MGTSRSTGAGGPTEGAWAERTAEEALSDGVGGAVRGVLGWGWVRGGGGGWADADILRRLPWPDRESSTATRGHTTRRAVPGKSPAEFGAPGEAAQFQQRQGGTHAVQRDS